MPYFVISVVKRRVEIFASGFLAKILPDLDNADIANQ
jgi:hypothetical protein